MEFIRNKISQGIRDQFDRTFEELRSKEKFMQAELEELQVCRQKTKQVLSEVHQATSELRTLLAELDGKMPVCESRSAGRTVHPPEGFLTEALHAADLRVVDIGGRLGPLTNFKSLSPFAHLFICEPDSEAAAQLPSGHADGWRSITAFGEAIAQTAGTVELNITRQPGLSSLLKPNTQVVENFYSTESWEIEKKISVPAITLDDAANKYGFAAPLIIKLDTQGSELEILKSGPETLDNTVGVYLEMNNLEFYEQQPAFSEVDSFLREKGFTLIDLKRTLLRRQTEERPIYSKRELAWSHGLYLRLGKSTLDQIEQRFIIPLFAVAVCMEFFDLAIALLETPGTASAFRGRWDVGLLKAAVAKQSKVVFHRLSEVINEEHQEAIKTLCYRDRKWER